MNKNEKYKKKNLEEKTMDYNIHLIILSIMFHKNKAKNHERWFYFLF